MMVASSIVVVMLPALDRHFRHDRSEAHDETALRLTVRTRSKGGEVWSGADVEDGTEEALCNACRDCRHVVKQLQLMETGGGLDWVSKGGLAVWA